VWGDLPVLPGSAKKHRPSVLQNESHPYLHEKDLRDFCAIHGIVFQVLSPSYISDAYESRLYLCGFFSGLFGAGLG
jgi:hypothetical protein